MWSSLSLCKQKEWREDEVQRGNPQFKCQAVHAILSLLFLFPLFCTSRELRFSTFISPPLPLGCLCMWAWLRGCARASWWLTFMIPVVRLERWRGAAFDTVPPESTNRGEEEWTQDACWSKTNFWKLWGGKDGKQRNEYWKMRQRRCTEHFPGFSYIVEFPLDKRLIVKCRAAQSCPRPLTFHTLMFHIFPLNFTWPSKLDKAYF